MRPRLCCIWLPRFGIHVATRLQASLLTTHLERVALYRPGTRWQELLESSPALEAAGILPGLPLKEALARAPDAVFLPCDDATLEAMVQAFDRVLDALDAFSPTVEPPAREQLAGARAAAYLDVSGLEALYGPEPILAGQLAAAAAAAAGCPARAGIAATKFTAWLAAWFAGEGRAVGVAQDGFAEEGRPTTDDRQQTDGLPHASRVILPGDETAFLTPLPLETLSLPIQTRLALRRLGVRTLGDYAKLPPNAVSHRYGEAGRHAYRLVQGQDDEPLRPRRPKAAARVEITFDWEETELDRLTFALKLLADQLAARLGALDQATTDGEDQQQEEDTGAEFADDSSHPDFWPEEISLQPGPPLSRKGRGDQGARAVSTKQTIPHHPRYAADALRIVWRLSGGEEREMLLRLAEPSAFASTFLEHLRWHAEGLDRFLATPPLAKGEDGDQPAAPSTSEGGQQSEGDLTYEPLEHRLAVTGISLEAMGIQVPSGTQLKLLAGPLRLAGAGTAAVLDPATRSRYARRAIARLQARWGAAAVQQAIVIPSRLPEHTFRLTEPSIDLQLNGVPSEDQSLFQGQQDRLKARAYPGRSERGRSVAQGSGSHASPTTHHPSLPDLFSPLHSHPPLWLLHPPEPISILTPRKGGRPVLSRPAVASGKTSSSQFYRSPAGVGAQHAAPPGEAKGRPSSSRIVHRGGPWKLVDPSALTTDEPVERDYYQIETEDGRACLVYWDRPANRWFLQGVFD
jgi:nucleotidyltransferase/DNA polymerase involved in DNA repair